MSKRKTTEDSSAQDSKEEMDMEYEDSAGDEDLAEEEDDGDTGTGETEPYIPGTYSLKEDEELVCDQTAYMLYHVAQTGAPCLSFDVINDPSFSGNTCKPTEITEPLNMFLCAGTQGVQDHANHIIVMRAFNMEPNKKGEDDDMELEDEDAEEDEELKKADLYTNMIKHSGSVNRLRHSYINGKNIVASWSSEAKVHLWNITHYIDNAQQNITLDTSHPQDKPIYTFDGHSFEGYAMDWSSTVPGRFLTGDCKKDIYLWTPNEAGQWSVDSQPFAGHISSVEDIQWSPNEDNVFLSCSVDKSLRVWDTRAHKSSMLTNANAHDLDINVIHWNRTEPFILSGGDDRILKVWDLRQFKNNEPVAQFKHHNGAITSVEWHPEESSVFAASGEDHQISQWDLSVEPDTDVQSDGAKEPDIPPQLLFIHQGQTDIKELHWHQQYPGVIISTAHTGFNIFRTISV